MNFLPYTKAREFKRRLSVNSSLSEDGVNYANLHPEARLFATSRWDRFIEFVESAKATKPDTTPWSFDDTFNILVCLSSFAVKTVR